MAHKERDFFSKEMADVTPLKGGERADLRTPGTPTLAQLARRQAAAARPVSDTNPLSMPEHIQLVDPRDIIGKKKNGVQEGVYRKLRLGHYPVQALLDLHRLTLREAREQVYRFLKGAHQQGLRTVQITHGKGQTASMKSHTLHWLEEHDLVLAYHSAPANQGGAGATLVLIRKKREQSQPGQ